MFSISKLVQRIRDVKIRKKLIGTYIIVGLVPVLIAGLILTNGMKNMAIEQAVKEADANVDRFHTRLAEIFRKITDVSERLYFDKALAGIATADYQSDWNLVQDYYSFKAFDEFRRSYREIRSIQFYSKNTKIIDNWEFRPATPEILKQPWYEKAMERNGELVWQYIYDDETREYNLCLTRLIKGNYGVRLGMLVIRLDNEYLRSMIREEPFEIIVAMDDGRVVLSKNASLSGSNVGKQGLDFIRNQPDNHMNEIMYHNNRSKVITYIYSPEKCRNVFNIYTLLPINVITKKANEISLLGFYIISLSFAVSLIFLVFFSRMFSSRIVRLRSEMHKVVQGNFDIDADIHGRDEVGELYEDLLAMIKSIKQLIFEVYEERLLKEQISSKQKEIEFKMLANQINPHFLYNALETIRMKAHARGEAEIVSIVKMLARIMRRNLEVTNKLVSLESEIELVTSYLGIQKFRFGDRVNYDISVQAEIAHYKVLHLLLQPIVENAFVHGLEAKRGQGLISIGIVEQDRFLVITVEDNGAGMDVEKLLGIRQSLEESADDVKTGIGLRNVHRRIKLYYGNGYGIKLSSRLNEGTKVSVYLPKEGEAAVC